MAERKKKTTAEKKTSAERRQTQARARSSSRPSRSQAEKRKKPMTKAEKEQQRLRELEAIRQRNQIMAVVLFAVSILMGCLVLIPGENIWAWLHNQLMGLFGVCAIFWPILLLYIAVVTALDRHDSKMSVKIILMVVIIVLLCAAVYVFGNEFRDISFWEELVALYADGQIRRGAGLFSGLLGIPLVAGFGSIGAKIFTILLLFVAVMILTGTSLIKLFRVVTKPAGAAAAAVGSARDRRRVERERPAGSVDVPFDREELPQHPVQSSARPRQKSDKLEELEKVFGIGPKEKKKEKAGEAAVPAAQESVPNPVAAAAAAQKLPSAPAAVEAVRKKEPETQEPIGTPVPFAKPEEAPVDGSYRFPPVTMLETSKEPNAADVTEELQSNGKMLVEALKSFGVQTKIVDICRGPTVTRYELQPAPGVKISKITNLADDIAMNLAATGVRIEAPIPGKAAVGVEVPNRRTSTVRMRELIESNQFQTAKSRLTVALGRDIAGEVTVADLAKMPHLLIAGTTGSGKSVCINSMIISMLYKSSPEEVRFLMIDPKVVELGVYNGIPHLLVPVVTDPRKAAGALGWAVTEMLKRYRIFAENNVRDLQGYNALAESCNYEDANGQPMLHMPQIVIIVDELSDLMMAAPNEVEDSICRLAQMARAAGMHLVIATQRPSVDVITGLIKANIPSRIALTVSSQVDSRTILDMGGAEKLLGRGDMLFAPIGSQKPIRVQGCFVSDAEIESIANFMKSAAEHEYDETIIDEIEKNAVAEKGRGKEEESSSDQDPMMAEAIQVVVEAAQASTSLLQRRLRLGYARAGRLIDEMEKMGIVGPHEGSKPRQVLITYQQWLEMNMRKADEVEIAAANKASSEKES